MAVVHADDAALHGFGQQLLGLLVTHSGEHDVNALECIGSGLADHDLLAAERDGLASGARARKRDEALHGEFPLLEALQHLTSNDARGTENRNNLA